MSLRPTVARLGRDFLPFVPTSLRNSYSVAVLTVFAALIGTLLSQQVVPDRHLSFVLFFAAVALSTGLGGIWPGVLATILSALTCDYFFLRPFHSFVISQSDLPLMLLFVITALLINGVSGRLRAQTRESDQRYYSLVQGLDGIVWEMNPRTMQFTFVSRRAELLLGYPVQAWLADPDFRSRITHPLDAAGVSKLWATALKASGEHTADYRAITIDRNEIWIRETVFVTHDVHGRPNRITGLGIDITTRKSEAEELMRLKDDLAVLNRVSAALSGSLELSDFSRVLQNELKDQLKIEAGRLYLLADKSGEMDIADSWGFQPEMRLEPKELVAGCSMDDPMPAQGMDKFTVSNITRSGPPDMSDRPIALAAVAIPLVAKDSLRGILALFKQDTFALDAGRNAFYASLGRQIGTLLQNVTLYQEVREAREHLHDLSRQLVGVQEAERRAIARELHDEVGQVLTGLKLTLEMSLRLPKESRAEQLGKALELVQGLINQVEGLSLDLRPPMLDDLGLLPALHWHCSRYTQLTGILIHLEHSGSDARFPAEIEITAYRIIQEALTNVARHAHVEMANIRLWVTREILGIQVSDKGRGFNANAVSQDGSMAGLTGMNERASLLGGHLTLETSPGFGTTITVDLPLHKND